MKKDRTYWRDVQAEAIRQMVLDGDAEERIIRVGGKKKKIYKIKPYVSED